MVEIKCPHCGFAKNVDRQQIPEGTKNINCPKCKQSFLWGELPGGGNEAAPAAQDNKFEFERGATSEFESKYCSSCGHKIHVKAELCPKCGVRVAPPAGAINKVALLLITFFLGGLGGHKFYQKKYLLGVLYLLFFWTYIPGIVALIEFIIYACKSEEELQRKYPEAGGAAVVFAVVIPFVAIAVIGILAAIAIPQFAAYRQKAYNAAAASDLKSCKVQADAYYADNQTYPAHPEEMQCNTATGISLYYFPLGAGDYQIVSFHENGNKAFVGSGDSTEIAEYTQEEIKAEIEEKYGATSLGSEFHFIE